MVYLALQEIFGSTEIFHGRTRELDVLKGIYREVCRRGTPSKNATLKTDAFSSQQSSILDEPSLNEEPSETILDDLTHTTSSFSPDGEHRSLSHNSHSHSASRTISESIRSERQHRRMMAFISGISGTGKSALVRQFVEDLRKESQKQNDDDTKTPTTKAPLFLTGKFNELAGSDPYSAFVEAFTEINTLLLGNDERPPKKEYENDLFRIQKDVKSRLGQEDVAVLTKVVPALQIILADSEHPPQKRNSVSTHKTKIQFEDSVETSTQNAWNRLKYVLQLFTKTIASRERPVIIFLDDLQWADIGSLDLIQSLVADKRIRNFMFIGTFRSDEVNSGHPLTQRINTIQKIQPIENLKLGNFTEEELVDFLHHHMEIDPIGCRNLAKKLHVTTGGNMFHVIDVLVELNQQCALNYSEFSKGWEWDDVAGMLVLETGLVENLDRAVKVKIMRSSTLVKKALVTMAYARSTIDVESLFLLMKTDEPTSCTLTIQHLGKALDKAVLEGFLSNNIGSHQYSFAHDKVLQASYALIHDGKEREKFRLTMGLKLYEIGLKNEKETWMLFAAAEHLNSSLTFSQTNPLFLAKVNLTIGEQASKISAYDQASKYLTAGLKCIMTIPDYHPWKADYDLTLQLHRAVADVELCLGRFENGNRIGRRLIEKARTLDDKLPTYESLALALGREELHAEAVEMNRDAMILLGEYPKRNRILFLIKELVVIMAYLKKTSDEDMLRLPVMTDKSKESALVFSRGLAIQAFYCDNHIEFLLATLRALQVTFQYGLSGYSAMAVVAYALVQMSGLNDSAGAVRSVRLAKDIVRVCDAKSQEPAFRFCVSHFVEGWSESHELTLENYRQGHLIGMEIGNIEDAFLNSYGAMHHARSCGSPLGSLELIGEELLEQMNLYKVKSILVLMEQIHIPVQYLTGNKENIEPDWAELGIEPKCNLDKSSENFRMMNYYISRMELGVYFGNFPFADRMARKLRSILPLNIAYVELSFRLFYSGLAASGMARKMRLEGKRIEALKYRAKGWRYCKRLGHLNRSIGDNGYHRELLLLADLNLCGKEHKRVSYDRAIHACLDVGHIHDAALGSELAGEHYLATYNKKNETGDSDATMKQIRRHFTRARDFYRSWGAFAKVKHLHKKRGEYILRRQSKCGPNEIEIGWVVSMELGGDDSLSKASENDDFSVNSGCCPQGMHNTNLLNLLAGIVPSSTVTDILSLTPKKDLEKKHGLTSKEIIKNDDASIVSDME